MHPNLDGGRCLRIRNHRADVAATHVGLHHHAPLAVLAADLVGTVDHLDLGDAGQRHIAAPRHRHLHLLEQADVGALRLRQADHHREATVAFEDLARRSEEHTSELQSLMRISYAVFCLKTKIHTKRIENKTEIYCRTIHRATYT